MVGFVFSTKMCFVAGTPIHTLDGLKNIEDIKPGDLVLTRSESDEPEVSGPLYRPVLQTVVTHPTELFHIAFQTDAGDEEVLKTTAGHPFYSVLERAFVYAEDLRVGDVLSRAEGRTAKVTGIRRERAPQGEAFTTHNFAVDETRTYFAGRSGVWVHNDSAFACERAATTFINSVKNQVHVRFAEDASPQLKRTLSALEQRTHGGLAKGSVEKHLDDALQLLQDQGIIKKSQRLAAVRSRVRRKPA